MIILATIVYLLEGDGVKRCQKAAFFSARIVNFKTIEVKETLEHLAVKPSAEVRYLCLHGVSPRPTR